MIAVIADDLTGAAEIGGIGLRYDLKVQICTEVGHLKNTDLLVIATDTRSMKVDEAQRKTAAITRQLSVLDPQPVYKKIDSVLRGHILPEIEVQLKTMNLSRALIVPANPALGRIIANGKYYVNDLPIHLSSFSQDPEFAITSPEVSDMLRANRTSVKAIKTDEPMEANGVMVGEAQTEDDLQKWARRSDEKTLLAGGSGFFSALLHWSGLSSSSTHAESVKQFGQPALYVCGTSFSKSRNSIKGIKSNGGPVSYMPVEIADPAQFQKIHYDEWSDEVVDLLTTAGKAIIGIDEGTTVRPEVHAADLREKMASTVNAILQKMPVRELVIEGGSTAASIIRKQGFKTFYPVQELMAGVVRMRIDGNDDLFMTIKPGSYDWPAEIWNFE